MFTKVTPRVAPPSLHVMDVLFSNVLSKSELVKSKYWLALVKIPTNH